MDEENKTPQQIFNTVWNWFVVELNCKSTDGLICNYRTPDGRKCAAGVLIPDDKYLPDMEDHTLYALLEIFDNLPSCFKDHAVIIDGLQMIHDDAPDDRNRFYAHMRTKLTEFAEIHNLSIPGAPC